MISSTVILLLPFFFLLHELEEIFMVPLWVKKNGTIMRRRFPKLERIINKMEQMTTQRFATIALEELLIVSVCTFVSLQTENQTAWYCCLAAFSIHLIGHIAQFVVWRGYIPAIISTALCLPYCIVAILKSHCYFTLSELIIYSLIGILLGGINLLLMHKLCTYYPTT